MQNLHFRSEHFSNHMTKQINPQHAEYVPLIYIMLFMVKTKNYIAQYIKPPILFF